MAISSEKNQLQVGFASKQFPVSLRLLPPSEKGRDSEREREREREFRRERETHRILDERAAHQGKIKKCKRQTANVVMG